MVTGRAFAMRPFVLTILLSNWPGKGVQNSGAGISASNIGTGQIVIHVVACRWHGASRCRCVRADPANCGSSAEVCEKCCACGFELAAACGFSQRVSLCRASGL